jgi:hypothetical protein
VLHPGQPYQAVLQPPATEPTAGTGPEGLLSKPQDPSLSEAQEGLVPSVFTSHWQSQPLCRLSAWPPFLLLSRKPNIVGLVTHEKD